MNDTQNDNQNDTEEVTEDGTGFTLDGRVMCSDDACIGTVGADGKCKVCGLAYDGDEVPGEPSKDAPADAPEEPPSKDAVPEGEVRELDPNERVCCPDDTCVGIIGPDGRCGTCGRAADSATEG